MDTAGPGFWPGIENDMAKAGQIERQCGQ